MEMASDARALAAIDNGQLGGQPKRTYPTDALIDSVSDAILQGKRSPLTIAGGPPLSERDRATLSAMSRIPAEEFVARLTADLQRVAMRCGERIMEKLESDAYKPEGLSYLYAVAIDKLNTLSGRASSIQNVNVQINNFGQKTESRDEVLARLHGLQDKREDRFVGPPMKSDNVKP